MDLSSLRALATSINFSVQAVPVTVTWTDPENAPVETTGIWGPLLEEDQPIGSNFRRLAPRRVMALPRTAFATLPAGTLIAAPEQSGGAVKTWKVDALGARLEADVWRAILVLCSGPP